jgi:hypothetical protein
MTAQAFRPWRDSESKPEPTRVGDRPIDLADLPGIISGASGNDRLSEILRREHASG